MADSSVELCLGEWSNLLSNKLEILRQESLFCDVVVHTSDGKSQKLMSTLTDIKVTRSKVLLNFINS